MICDEKLGPPNTTYMVRDAFITENRDNLLFFSPTESTQGREGWFTLNGVRLPDKPTGKGIYIHNGKKVFVK